MTADKVRKKRNQVVRKVGKRTSTPSALNPSLKPLQVLAGDWNMELSNAAFLPSPSDKVVGHASIEWLEHGAVLAMRAGAKRSKASDSIWLIGRDESTPDYHVLYFDSRGVSRVYQMSFAGGVWEMWRNAPGFSQRFEGIVSHDENTIAARWEKSTDGIKWEHDFDVTYTRIK